MANRPAKLRKWSEESMKLAYNDVKAGRKTINAAAKMYHVPRMTLSDRVHGKVSVEAKMGVKTALTTEEESALCNYISYMADRGFPLSIQQLIGFAWCIAKEHGKNHVFTERGPSRKWWQGFKSRHPDLGIRRPDPLDRGRACGGTEYALRDYFSLLKDTLDSNGLNDKPERIYNCDESALYLNKSAGQKVLVPARTKHAHSLSIATNEHISVHCCVNAAGQALPPMIIFTKCLPGGPYHRQGPVNASYACSESGFMDQQLYLQWFEKTFLQYAVSQRPILLIQDGASSHLSVSLIRSAIANDVILLCLPAKTTHITQPLDVAVYRKMKIETAKVVNQAKMVKNDLWISKKNVSAVFKVIFEKSFTIDCITEGFRKCGIHPFDPNAVDKSLLLRSCTNIEANSIDLSIPPSKPTETPNTANVQLSECDVNFQRSDHGKVHDNDVMLDVSFIVGNDGILTLEPPTCVSPEQDDRLSETADGSPSDCPPDLALAALECSLTPRKKRKFEDCFNCEVELNDTLFQTWRRLKLKIPQIDPFQPVVPSSSPISHNTSSSGSLPSPDTVQSHPLVQAGLIPEDLVNVLIVPATAQKSVKRKTFGKARVLTSTEVQKELEEREAKKRLETENKLKRKKEREEKRVEKEQQQLKRKAEIQQRKQAREKLKAEKQKAKEEREKQRAHNKSKAVADTNGVL